MDGFQSLLPTLKGDSSIALTFSSSIAAILATWCDPAKSIVDLVAMAARRIFSAESDDSRASVGKNAVLQPPGRLTCDEQLLICSFQLVYTWMVLVVQYS